VLTATSANPPGAAPGTHSQQVRAAFASAVLDGGLVVLDGVAPGGQPSTLVAVDGNELCVVRQGRIPSAELERVVAG
jgi:tRNA A37 threonylcarbamoyladenosine synthetase subunit TsaC/SUA5/YrdC